MNLSTFATDRGFAAAGQIDLQVSSAREGSAIQLRQRLIHSEGSTRLKPELLPSPCMAAASLARRPVIPSLGQLSCPATVGNLETESRGY